MNRVPQAPYHVGVRLSSRPPAELWRLAQRLVSRLDPGAPGWCHARCEADARTLRAVLLEIRMRGTQLTLDDVPSLCLRCWE